MINRLISGKLLIIYRVSSTWERDAWKSGNHKVILHPSKASKPNPEEHNFVNGYICTIDKEWLVGTYPKMDLFYEGSYWGSYKWIWINENPKFVKGEDLCTSTK